jgi:NAD(P)-dependent dehydrogenase (short-subunit alcohol dehydrogenase family)
VRNVIVSGAADGIGLGIANRFAAAGDRVAMLDLDTAKLEPAVERVRADGGEAIGLTVDVRDAASVREAVQATLDAFGRLDVAVSNAGVYPNKPVLEMEEDEWDRVLDTNLKGTFLVTRAAARQMVAQGGGGKICTIASGAHLLGRIGAAHYCASKAGLVLYTKVLAMELAEHRINVNVVSPGFVDVGERAGVSDHYRETISKSIPWGRTGRPADVANAVFFVCSDEAEFITGAVLSVDGGTSAGRFYLPRSD